MESNPTYLSRHRRYRTVGICAKGYMMLTNLGGFLSSHPLSMTETLHDEVHTLCV